jgi:hypothetical protein
VQPCPRIPGETRRSGVAPPPGAAAGPHTAGRPSWQAALPPTAAGGLTAAAGVASMAGMVGQEGGPPMAVGVLGVELGVGVAGPSTRSGILVLAYGVGPGAAGLGV